MKTNAAFIGSIALISLLSFICRKQVEINIQIINKNLNTNHILIQITVRQLL